MRPRKHQNLKVKIFYPETSEGIKELQESQSQAMLYILEKRLGTEGLGHFIEYARNMLEKK